MSFRTIDGTRASNKTNSCKSRVQSRTDNARMSVKLAIFDVLRKIETKTLESHLYDHHGIKNVHVRRTEGARRLLLCPAC